MSRSEAKFDESVLNLIQVFMIGIGACFAIWCLSQMWIKTFGWDEYSSAISQCQMPVRVYVGDGINKLPYQVDENVLKTVTECQKQVTLKFTHEPTPTLKVD